MKTVKSGLKDKTRVAFFEQHPDHPGGEAFISDDKEHKIGDTQLVRSAIQAGKLVEVEKNAPAKGKVETEPAEEPVDKSEPEKQPEPIKSKPKATKGK